MATLLSHITEVLSGNGIDKAHPGDTLAAAKLHNDHGNHELMRVMIESIAGIDDLSYAREAKKMLSLIHKRSGQWLEAVCLWEDIAATDSRDIFVLAELAKFCEHRSHDTRRALAIVEQALGHDLLTEDERASFEHRRKRLILKIDGSNRI
jgi:hypothetical protein